MVFLSIVILCVNTHQDLQIVLPNGRRGDNPKLAKVELVCLVWFSVEYFIRLISSPNKKRFLKGFMNAIDLLAAFPLYIQLIMELSTGGAISNLMDVRKFIQVLRIIRVMRIFKLARHSTGLQVLGYTLKNSLEELGLLMLLLMMGMILFSTLAFYAEEEIPGTKYKSIIEAFWWAITTMTTIGYGDMYPVTTQGKIIGCMCCVSGTLFIALPIPTIVGNFSKYYSEHRNRLKMESMKKASTTIDEPNPLHLSLNRAPTERVSYYHFRPSSIKPMPI